MNIGERLKKRRLDLGLTLEYVAKVVGVSKSTVMKWETGFIENMKRDKIALLATALQTTPLWVMGIDDSALSPPPVLSPIERLRKEYHAILRGNELPPETAELIIAFAEYLETNPDGDEAKVVSDFMQTVTKRKKK